jgi:hypothetical protein
MTNEAWITEKVACNKLGSRHAQELSIWKLPYVTQAAMIAPSGHETIMKETTFPRWVGYVTSESKGGAAVDTIPRPKPMMKRDATNMP